MIYKGTIVSASPVPAPAAAEEAKPAKPRGKKLLIVAVLALVLMGAAVAGWVMWSRHNAALAEGDGEDGAAAHAAAKVPPTFLPLENMVINLADPGGERMAQIGITVELSDPKAVDKVKAYLPSIRSAILLLISQRTAAELLQREGKEKLAHDILREVSKPLGFTVGPLAEPAARPASGAAPKTVKKPKAGENAEPNPVQGILFSSFIVQ